MNTFLLFLSASLNLASIFIILDLFKLTKKEQKLVDTYLDAYSKCLDSLIKAEAELDAIKEGKSFNVFSLNDEGINYKITNSHADIEISSKIITNTERLIGGLAFYFSGGRFIVYGTDEQIKFISDQLKK